MWTALLLIPFDLAARDILHESWSGKNLKRNMALLILVAAILTFVVNSGAKEIALASCLAFAVSATVDTLVYHWLKAKPAYIKMNLSNISGAVTDSLIFPLVAFSAINFSLSGAQASLKIAGGFFWSYILVTLYSFLTRRNH